MRFIFTIDVAAEDGQDPDRLDIAKDLQLYLMDFAQNLPAIQATDIEGGFHVTGAYSREFG